MSFMLSAQENDGIVYPNTMFGSFAVGGSLYSHSGQSAFGVPAVNLTGGVWLAEPLAFELAADVLMGSDNSFLAASAGFKWDINSTFFHIYNKNFLSPIPFYPILGMGGIWGLDPGGEQLVTENSFQLLLGLQAPFRIGQYMDAFLQYKCFFLPQDFSGSHGDNYIHMLALGLQFRQSTEPFHRRTEHYTRSIAEDWFFALGIGPNYSAFDLLTNANLGGTSMIGVAPEIMLGRNFSNFWSVRFVLNGLSAFEQYDTVQLSHGKGYKYSFLHADLMLNVGNLIWRGRGVHFNIIPYIGSGPVWRYDALRFDLAADAGVQFRYYLSRKSDLYLDARYVMVAPSVGGGTGPSGHFYGVGLPSITLGYIYNFGHNTTRYRIPLFEVKR